MVVMMRCGARRWKRKENGWPENKKEEGEGRLVEEIHEGRQADERCLGGTGSKHGLGWSGSVLHLKAIFATLAKFGNDPTFREENVGAHFAQLTRGEELVAGGDQGIPCLRWGEVPWIAVHVGWRFVPLVIVFVGRGWGRRS